jgi:hypothetical protein
LKDRFAVFFAVEQEAYLWGVQLGDSLPQIYGEQSRFVLVVSSEAYVAKYWPQVEFRAAKHKMATTCSLSTLGGCHPTCPVTLCTGGATRQAWSPS